MAEEVQIISGENQKKKIQKKFQKLRKKKSFWVISILVVLVLAGGTVFFTVKAKKAKSTAMTTTVQSSEAETGSISTTVEATGTLANAETVDVVVPTGITVDSVLVSSGDTVTQGQQLATLNQTSIIKAMISAQDSLDSLQTQLENTSSLSSLEIEQLKAEKADVEESLAALTTLHDSPVITATEAGVIDSVNISDGTEITKSSSTENTSGNSTNTDTGSGTSGITNTSASIDAGSSLITLSADVSGSASTGNAAETYAANGMTTVTDYNTLEVTAPKTGEEPQSKISGTDTYTGTITWNCSGKTFQSGTVYTATIVLTAAANYTFAESNLPIINCSAFNWTIYDNGNKLKIEAAFEATASDSQNTGNAAEGSEGQSSSSGNAGQSASGSASGGSASGGTTSSGTASSGTTSTEVYSNYEMAAFSIAKQDNVVISVSVDELDILSVEKDQTATVTMDAIDGETFEGTITKVAATASASSSGSSSKYAVEITIPKKEDMRIGMSASAVIQVSESENAVLIPIDALQEKGDSAFVYTKKDSDGNLSGEVEVETGISNGTQVEIKSGLSDGDTVYYMKVSSSDSSSDNNEFPGKMGNMPSGEDMPGGGSFSGGGSGSGSSGGGQPPSN